MSNLHQREWAAIWRIVYISTFSGTGYWNIFQCFFIFFRRSCERRRKMTISRTASGEEDPRKFAEERRLVLLLGSTSILFLICVTPMVILNVTLSEVNLMKYPYQVNLGLYILGNLTIFYMFCRYFEQLPIFSKWRTTRSHFISTSPFRKISEVPSWERSTATIRLHSKE